MNVWNGTPRLDGVRVLLVEGAPQVSDVVADGLGQCGTMSPTTRKDRLRLLLPT